LSAQGSGCTPMEHALTQFPYAVVAGVASALGFFVVAAIQG